MYFVNSCEKCCIFWPVLHPRLLHCNHVFCEDCQAHLFAGKGKYLPCPMCLQPVQLPDGGVPTLPPASNISKLLLELRLAKRDTMECPQHNQPLDILSDLSGAGVPWLCYMFTQRPSCWTACHAWATAEKRYAASEATGLQIIYTSHELPVHAVTYNSNIVLLDYKHA